MDSVEVRGGQSPEARGAAGSPGSHHCCRARVVQPPTANPALVLAGQIVPRLQLHNQESRSQPTRGGQGHSRRRLASHGQVLPRTPSRPLCKLVPTHQTKNCRRD